MSNSPQQQPYLPRQRNFNSESTLKLAASLDKAYIEIASKVNDRMIGKFSTNQPSRTGEEWFLKGQAKKQQSQRQVYTFNNTNTISHGISFSQIDNITRMWGQFTDGTNWYGVIPAGSISIAGQLSFYLTESNITFVSGAGAPTVQSGIIVLEWLPEV